MGFFSRLFGFGSSGSTLDDDTLNHVTEIETTQINPANGLPMVGSVDLEANPYGFDNNDTVTGLDDSFSSMDDSSDFMSDSFSDMDDSFNSFDNNF